MWDRGLYPLKCFFQHCTQDRWQPQIGYPQFAPDERSLLGQQGMEAMIHKENRLLGAWRRQRNAGRMEKPVWVNMAKKNLLHLSVVCTPHGNRCLRRNFISWRGKPCMEGNEGNLGGKNRDGGRCLWGKNTLKNVDADSFHEGFSSLFPHTTPFFYIRREALSRLFGHICWYFVSSSWSGGQEKRRRQHLKGNKGRAVTV